MSLNKLFPNFLRINSIKEDPFGNSFLIFFPKYIKKNIGKAVPREYPMTAPIPPQVAAEAVKLVVKENNPIFLFAVK